jgi:imipenem/basic amino acid-specific outer membrane pore
MKRSILMSLVVVGLVSSVNAADNLESMFSEGKASGQIRSFYINRDDTTKDDNQIATAIGGKLKFETAEWGGVTLGTGFYTTNRVLRSLETDAMGPNTTLLSNDGSSYSILGEAYLQYKRGNTVFKGGRQKLDTPFAGSDDARMVPNLFEAYVLSNTDIANTTLIAAHVTRMAPGSFSNAYNGGIVGATGGYTAVAGNTAAYQGDFTDMGSWAIGENTAGVTALAAIYGNDYIKVQAWDYYAHDILNAFYGQVDAHWNCLLSDAVKPFAAVQFIKENGVGDYVTQDVDSMYWAAKFGASVAGFKAYVAYSQQSKADNADEILNNATLSPWGGMPAFTQGMVTRHMFLAGTAATKVAATYDFKSLGLNLAATGYYATFDLDTNSGLGDITTNEPGFDIQYYPAAVKNLQLRIRGNFPTEFAKDRDWNEYRFIANYNF